MRTLAALGVVAGLGIAGCGSESGDGSASQAGSAGAGAVGTGGASSGGASSGGSGTGGSVAGLSPKITASALEGAAPLEVDFGACASESASAPIALYAWDFGDGSTTLGSAPSHTFSEGTHEVKLSVTTSDGQTASTTVQIVAEAAPAEVFVTDATKHPRLYFDAAGLAKLRARIDRVPILGKEGKRESYVTGYLLTTDWQAAGDYANKTCAGLLGGSLQSGGAQIGQARAIADCVTTLAVGSVLSPDAQKSALYAKVATDALLTMANTWPKEGSLNAGFGRWVCGACLDKGSNLNNGELLYATALAFDLLHDEMTATARDAVRNLLLRETRFLFQASPKSWWAGPGGNNWKALTHGPLGVAALVLEGEPGVPDAEVDQWVELATKMVEEYFATNYDADGVNYEDWAHSMYGLTFATHYLHVLENVRGEDHFELQNGLLRRILRYWVNALDGNANGFMPNDGVGRLGSTQPTLLLLAARLRDGFGQWTWDRISGVGRPESNAFPFKVGGDGAQSLVPWTGMLYDDTVPLENPAGRLPLGAVYPDFGRAFFRSSWSGDSVLLSTESGVYGSHGRPNQGHYFLTAYGKHLVDDADGGESQGYNVVTVDGQSQKKSSDSFEILATTLGSIVGSGASWVGYDQKKAYGSTALDKARRDFVFVQPSASRGAFAVVVDDIGAANEHTYAARVHFDKALALSSVKTGHHRASSGALGIEVVTLSPPGASFDTAGGLTASIKQKSAVFAQALLPFDATHPLPALTSFEAGAARGLTVGDATVLVNAGGGAITHDGLETNARLVVRVNGTPATTLLLVDASQAALAGKKLLTSAQPTSVELVVSSGELRATVAASSALELAAPSSGSTLLVTNEAFSKLVTPSAAGLVAVDSSGPSRFALFPAQAVASCTP